MDNTISALKVALPHEVIDAIVSIDGNWCFVNGYNDLVILDALHISGNEKEDTGGCQEDAVEAAKLLDGQPSCNGWREVAFLVIAPK